MQSLEQSLAVGAIGWRIIGVGLDECLKHYGDNLLDAMGIEPKMKVGIHSFTFVVFMFVMVVPVMSVLAMVVLVVSVFVMVMFVMPVVSMLVMFAFIRDKGNYASGLCDRFDAFALKVGTYPKQHIGILEAFSIGRTHSIVVRVCRAGNQEAWRANALHERGCDGVDWFDACDNAQACLLRVCDECRECEDDDERNLFHFDLTFMVVTSGAPSYTTSCFFCKLDVQGGMNTAKEDILLRARGVSLRRGGNVLLDSVDISVGVGEIVTIIGPNGAGKTSLLRVLLGLVKPTEGEVERRADVRIGYLPQQPRVDSLVPMSVSRFLAMGGSRSKDAIVTTSRECGVEARLDGPLRSLSGGEWQRVLLARALLTEPNLLILDEPTSNVDFAGQISFYGLLSELRDRRGCGILMVSHDLHMVMGSTDIVVCLDRHVCCSGSAEAIARHPEYARLFAPATASMLAIYPHHHPAGHEREHT